VSQALHRATVRCLYDPALVARLRAGERLPELSEQEHGWLLAVDPRAWTTDPYRRSRSLTALLDEFPVAAAVRGVRACDGFFSSQAFHRCIQDRGRLALAFGTWLGPVATLELAIARSRRPGPVAGLRLAPGVAAVTVPEGFLAWFVAARAEVLPLETLVGGARPSAAPPTEGDEHLIIEPGVDGPQVGGGSAALNAFLDFCASGTTREAALAEARRLGCEPGDDESLLAELVGDGLLVGGAEGG